MSNFKTKIKMKLLKNTFFKEILCLFILSFLITSCEPEEIPVDENKNAVQLSNKVAETGDQEKTADEKKP